MEILELSEIGMGAVTLLKKTLTFHFAFALVFIY
jgi:hypothetical protein